MSSAENGGMNGAAKNKAATQCFLKGNDALEKQNYDYAVQMYATCASLIPDNLTYRQCARGAAYKKYNDNKTGAGTLAKAKLVGIRNKIKKAKSAEKWDEVDKLAESGLMINPWDAQLNVDLGESAQQRELLDIAKFAYMCARNTDPNNKEYNRLLALVMEEKMEFTEASKVWSQILKIDPNDGDARSNATRCDFEAVRTRGGYEEAKSTTDVAVQKAHLFKKPGEADAPGMSVEKDLQHAIRKEPEKVEHYLKLSDHYRKNKQLDEARQTLKKAHEVSGGDPNIHEQIEDVELDQMRHNLAIAREKAASDPDEPVYQEKLKKVATELLKRELHVFSGRVERYPKDMQLKVEFADRLMRVKKWQQAIPLLQPAAQHTKLKGRALFMLGKCFMHDGKIKLARGQIERALPEIDPSDDTQKSLLLEAHYVMGRICEELGDTVVAEEQYGEVITIDYDYKDALKRLEKLQGGE
ncbi:MAG: tetratricopeptide repeat protein [Planctomycetaceae bacterium]|nr:tetratricopeptide repeat protein [Planctomycetaceae bacterium]